MNLDTGTQTQLFASALNFSFEFMYNAIGIY